FSSDSTRIALNAGRIKMHASNSLMITNVNRDDEGWYRCVVEDENRISYNETAYLSVVSLASIKPTFDTLPKMDELKPKKKAPPAKITRVYGFVRGNDVRLLWELEQTEAVARIATFVVQSRKEGESKWVDVSQSMGHTKATLVTNLTPMTKYKFRVTAVNEDKSASAGTESEWMETMEPTREYKPKPPVITKVDPISSQSIRLFWVHHANHNLSLASSFVITYGKDDQTDSSTQKVDGATRIWTVTGLKENASYTFSIHAENLAGESERSNVVTAKTMHPDEERRGLLSLLQKGLMDMLPGTEDQRVHVLLLLCIIPLLFLLLCCGCCCRYHSNKKRKSGGANKFLDTSYSIYNQQKVHRNKLTEPYDPKEFFEQDNIDEHLPLRGNNNEDRVSLNSRSSRRFRVAGGRPFPNLYGRGDEESDEDHNDVDHLAPLDNHYGMMAGGILSYNPVGASLSSARCYSTDTGVSREVLVPPLPPLLSNGGIALYQPNCQTPLPPIPPLMSAVCSPLKSATSVSYKTSGDAAIIAYSPGSLAESGGSGSGQTRTTNADSPTHPLTDGSENGGVRGDSSRNSQISSVDGRYQPLNSFKSGSTVPPLMSTFAR
ncbi:hypothetical protein PFISCL1PPCAC_26762, partial [Pristionchus fissidentatus]